MANKKLSYDQIADRNLFAPLEKEIEDLSKRLDALAEKLKGIAQANAEIAKQTPLDSYDNINKVGKAIDETTKSVKDLEKVEKQRVQLQERLKSLDESRTKANLGLRLEIQERTRALKNEIKETSESAGAYTNLSARLNRLRKEYKDLAAAGKENTAEARALLEETQALDKKLKDVDASVGQYQRSVGNYEKAVNGLRGAFSKLAAATGIIKLLELVADGFAKNRETTDALGKAFGRITVTITVFVSRVAKILPMIGDIFTRIQMKFERFILSVQQGLASLPGVLGGSEEAAGKLERKIADLDARMSNLSGIGDITGAFSGMGEEIAGLIEQNDKLIDSTTRFEKASYPTENRVGRPDQDARVVSRGCRR